MAGPLSGLRIVELPAIGPIPLLGTLLADLGADVVRIDRLHDANPLSATLIAGPMGRGRRSVGMDLRRPGAAEIVLRLAAGSDALVEGFRPGVAERLGVGPSAALERNPALVYGRLTGWGQDGPLAATAGHDITYLALTGLLHGIGPADGPPIPPVNYLADFGGGTMSLATGLLAALLQARISGVGQVVDAAMVEGAGYLASMTRAWLGSGDWRDEPGANLLDGAAPNYRCYACSDGRYVAVGALEPQFWAVLVATLGLADRELGSPYDRSNWPALQATLAEVFATRSREEWAALFEKLDACVAPVLSLTEATRHPHNVARQSFVEVAGVPMPAPAPRFSATPATVGAPTPPGRDTAELLDELGYGASEVQRLRAGGVIA